MRSKNIKKNLVIAISFFQLIYCSSSGSGLKYNPDTNPDEFFREAWEKDCPKETNISQGPSDGRFTIGIGAKRLMYGFPSPRSTSYFVLKVGSQLASNSPKFCEATYITGTEDIDYYNGITMVRYNFLDVEIEQLLIPTDEGLEHVTSEISPKYYRVEYNITNKSGKNQAIGLSVMIDTMIDDNDGPRIAIYNETKQNLAFVDRETGYLGGSMPKGILLFHQGNDISGLTGDLVLKHEESRPDELLVGSWPHFISRAWGISPNNANYSDSAVIMRWNNKSVSKNDSTSFHFFYGIANNSSEGLDVLLNDDKMQEQKSSVQYGKGAIALTSEQKKYLDELFETAKGKDITLVTIEGYADATGTDRMNEMVSKQRAMRVQEYVSQKYKVPKEIIIIKPMAASVARKTEDALKNGNPEDRKVVVGIATREKKNITDPSSNVTKKNFKTLAEKAQQCNFLFKNGQTKKLVRMSPKSVSANIDGKVIEIKKKELKTISLIR